MNILQIGLIAVAAFSAKVSCGVVINEFMADNEYVYMSEDGAGEDWVELYNGSGQPVDIGGCYLTDDFSNPSKWQFPRGVPEKTTIAQEGYLLVWLDGNSHGTGLHANFKLDADGECIGLYSTDGTTVMDAKVFSKQHENISYGRAHDGSSEWRVFEKPTPEKSNNLADEITDYYITCDPQQYAFIYTYYNEDHDIPVTLACRGQTWQDATMRIRGDGSREFPKKSLRIEFGVKPFVNGRTAISLNAEYLDQSYLHTVLASTLMKKSGQECFSAEYARVHINGVFSGLYVAVENVDSDFLEKNGLDTDANLYKAKMDGACMSRFDDVYYHWEKKTNTDENSDDLAELITMLDTVADQNFSAAVKKAFDYDELVNIIAMNLLLNNGSTYYHNYYLYHDIHGTGKWKMLPWDMDQTFNSCPVDLSYSRSSNPWSPDNTLLERAMINGGMRSDIRRRVETLSSFCVNSDTLAPLIDSLKSGIILSVADDTSDTIADTLLFLQKVDAVREHIRIRRTYLENQFDHAPYPFVVNGKAERCTGGLLFKWHRAIDPDGDSLVYTLRYATQPNLADPSAMVITDIHDTVYILSDSLKVGVYYWAVTVSDGRYSTEGYNTWNTFTIHPGNICLSLPGYTLSIDPENCAKLEAEPLSDAFYPATLSCGQREYACTVRYRGTSTRSLPKKSYHVEFPDNKNPFGGKCIKFNAEYRDGSLMRNNLAMKLFEFMNRPVSKTQHVNLFINNRYAGVYLSVESVNAAFLERNKREKGDLYKAVTLGAMMAPICNPDRFNATWEKKRGEVHDHAAVKTFLNRVYYWTDADFNDSIAFVADVESILSYFAVQLALVNADGMIKNMYLYSNGVGGRWELFPWDMDASFGNDFEGVYRSGNERIVHFDPFDRNVLLNRLLEIPKWEAVFATLYRRVVNQGFVWAAQQADSLYAAIRPDVLQDTSKKTDNGGFDREVLQLKTFLTNRTAATGTLSEVRNSRLYQVEMVNTMPSPEHPDVVVRARSDVAEPVFLTYTTDVSFTAYGQKYTETKLELFDDGLHDDGGAGDSVYGNKLTINKDFPPAVPVTFQRGTTTTPPNGLYAINYYPIATYSFSPQKTSADVKRSVVIESVYTDGNTYGVLLKNTDSAEVNLSNACLQTGRYYNVFTLPESCILAPFESVFVADEWYNQQVATGGVTTVRGLFLKPRPGDTLSLLTPAHEKITSLRVTTLQQAVHRVAGAVDKRVHFSVNRSNDVVEFNLTAPDRVSVTVYNVKGQVVERVVDAHLAPARYRLPLLRQQRSTGCYLVRCIAGRNVCLVKRVVAAR